MGTLGRDAHERAVERLKESFDEVISQWGRYMGHVAAVIGGAESQEKYGTGQRFFPVAAARQGNTFLLIYAPSDLEAERAMNVVHRVPFNFAHRYHRLAIQVLD